MWTAQHGVACRGVSWERHSLQELLTIVTCVGARPLAAICRLLAEDYSGWSGAGFCHLVWHTSALHRERQRPARSARMLMLPWAFHWPDRC